MNMRKKMIVLIMFLFIGSASLSCAAAFPSNGRVKTVDARFIMTPEDIPELKFVRMIHYSCVGSRIDELYYDDRIDSIVLVVFVIVYNQRTGEIMKELNSYHYMYEGEVVSFVYNLVKKKFLEFNVSKDVNLHYFLKKWLWLYKKELQLEKEGV